MVSSAILLAVSLTSPGSEFMWGALKPLSATLFGAAFISYLLANEYAKYDEEHKKDAELQRKANGQGDEETPRDG
jgi:hypothetical protein